LQNSSAKPNFHRLGQKTVTGVAIEGMKQALIFITPGTMNSALREHLWYRTASAQSQASFDCAADETSRKAMDCNAA
jgi:hypothetical protein